MNWPVLKDKKWLALQSISILLAVIAIVLASANNGYWLPSIVFSMILLSLAVRRATKLTR